MRYARHEGGIVRDVFNWPDDVPVLGSVSAEAAAQLVPAPEGVKLGDAYDAASQTFGPPPLPPLEDVRLRLKGQVEMELLERILAGAPVGGLHVSLEDASRADLGGMATTAAAALAGSVPWPAEYVRGWISNENVRIPMEAPEVGLQLASGVGAYYAGLRQHSRDLKDAIAAATTREQLAAIAPAEGWPTGEPGNA